MSVESTEQSGFDIMENWQNANGIHHFEMSTNNLDTLVNTLGYADTDDFLRDNPGAQEAIVEWITNELDRQAEWRESLVNDTPEDEGDTDEP